MWGMPDQTAGFSPMARAQDFWCPRWPSREGRVPATIAVSSYPPASPGWWECGTPDVDRRGWPRHRSVDELIEGVASDSSRIRYSNPGQPTPPEPFIGHAQMGNEVSIPQTWRPLRTHISTPVRSIARPARCRTRHLFGEPAGWPRRSTVVPGLIRASERQCGSMSAATKAAVPAVHMRRRTS